MTDTTAAPTITRESSLVVELPRAFASRYGAPVIRRVALEIFTHRYFTHCLQCGFCHDACCNEGVDVDLVHVAAIEQHAGELERFTGIPRTSWFRARATPDPEMPGGGSRRTRLHNGRCVFLNTAGRGCLIHSYCLREGIDYHDLKSIVDCLFPVTFCEETLCSANEVDNGSLVCLDTGPTLYRGARSEISYYFGEACVEALDRIESLTPASGEPPRHPKPELSEGEGSLAARP